MLNGLDLFTGIGGITLALRDYVRPVAYCEIEPYCQSVLLSRMQERNLPQAPIWNDIRTLPINELPEIDIIYGGFPCQDISCAGTGKGLEGERSGLFFEIVRISKEIKPQFIFLENVPAITTRGGLQVVREIASMGYDCRWCIISAASVGAVHLRKRWFLLAHSNGENVEGHRERTQRIKERYDKLSCTSEDDCKTNSITDKQADINSLPFCKIRETRRNDNSKYWTYKSRANWQEIVSTICRVDDGVPNRVDRLKALGNSVVPVQVTEAFELLMGII
jgi:DNA (cytosine-5)-methyltransferase 1